MLVPITFFNQQRFTKGACNKKTCVLIGRGGGGGIQKKTKKTVEIFETKVFELRFLPFCII